MIVSRNILFNIIRYSIGISVIIACIYYVQKQENILPVLNEFHVELLFPVCLFIMLHLISLYLLWKRLIKGLGSIKPQERQVLHSFFGGRTMGFISPGHTGELFKGLFFSRGQRLEATGLSLINSGYGMLIRLVLGICACIYFIYRVSSLITLFRYITISLVFILILGIVVYKYRKKIFNKLSFNSILIKQLCDVLSYMSNHFKNNSSLFVIKNLTISIAANLFSVIAFMFLLKGFSISVDYIDGLMAYEASYLVMSLLPFTPAGIGMREGARVFFFTLIGSSSAAVLCASFLMTLFNIILPAIMGMWSINYIVKEASK